MSKIKHPYEKKQKSLDKDCRNNYGENDKSSRKAIRQGKARQHREERRISKKPLSTIHLQLNLEQIDELAFQSNLQSYQNRLTGFKKWSDIPLRQILQARTLKKVS